MHKRHAEGMQSGTVKVHLRLLLRVLLLEHYQSSLRRDYPELRIIFIQ
jgi:hypothetical protein